MQCRVDGGGHLVHTLPLTPDWDTQCQTQSTEVVTVDHVTRTLAAHLVSDAAKLFNRESV